MSDESTMLRVGTKTDPGSFAGAVFKSLERGDEVQARAFGASATFVMVKGTDLAHKFFENHGKRLYVRMSTASETLEDGFQIRSVTFTYSVVPEEDQLDVGLN